MADPLQLLREDHRKVQELFKRFEATEDASEKKQIADQAIFELQVHEKLEEQIFYPAVRAEANIEDETMDEAEEEHHVVDLVIDEISGMRPREKNYDAKFMVLAENVKHHIQEEESEMLPRAAELGSDRLEELGDQMMELKQKLMAAGPRGMRRGSRNGRTRGGTRTRATRTPRTRGATRGPRTAASRSRSGRATTTRSRGNSTRRRTSGTARSTSRTSGRGRARAGRRSR
jgi:hypothetical protein